MKVDDFTSKVRAWELRNAGVMADYWSNQLCIREVSPFPVLERTTPPELLLFDAFCRTKTCVSGYLQLYDDAALGEYLRDGNFVELLQKMGVAPYNLPKPVEFTEEALFSYVFSGPERVEELDTEQFIKIPERIEERDKKRK